MSNGFLSVVVTGNLVERIDYQMSEGLKKNVQATKECCVCRRRVEGRRGNGSESEPKRKNKSE